MRANWRYRAQRVEERHGRLDEDVTALRASLSPLPEPGHPVLVLVAGLPGSGKSYFSRVLAQRVPLALLESDALRRILVPQPTHTPSEHARVFLAAHQLIEDLLCLGMPVLFDATNLVESNRAHLYRIPTRTRVPVVVVWVTAPPEVVSQRLHERQRTAGGIPVADWSVYQRMRLTAEPVRCPHIVVDTSQDLGPALVRIASEVRCAAGAPEWGGEMVWDE